MCHKDESGNLWDEIEKGLRRDRNFAIFSVIVAFISLVFALGVCVEKSRERAATAVTLQPEAPR